MLPMPLGQARQEETENVSITTANQIKRQNAFTAQKDSQPTHSSPVQMGNLGDRGGDRDGKERGKRKEVFEKLLLRLFSFPYM